MDYKKYLNCDMVVTKLNLFELYYSTFIKYGEEIAEKELFKNSDFAINFDNEIIKEAAKLKAAFRKQDLSMADCIGYITAKKLEIKFLTGDKQFQFLPDVEFVK